MGKRLRAVAVLGLGLLAVAAPALGGQEAVESDTPVLMTAPVRGLRVGERLSFHGRWFGIPVGHGSIEVKELTTWQGRPAYRIEAEGASNEILSAFYPVHDSIRSYLDAATLQPLQFEKDQREGHYRAREIVTFDYEQGIAVYHSYLNQSTKRVPIPGDVHDIISVFYWLRTQPVEPGRPVTVPLYSDEKVYATVIRPLKTLMLGLLRQGTFPCLMVEPLARFKGILVRRGRLVAYVTADARRIPLLVKIWTPWGLITGTIDREALQRAYALAMSPT